MDALVCVGSGGVGTWDIYARNPKDLQLGTVEQDEEGQFSIRPSAEALTGVDPGRRADLDSAMKAVAHRIGGSCEKWVP